MTKAAKTINILAFAVLFFDYAVAMQPAENHGTRRLLQVYAKQLPTGAMPTPKPAWDLGIKLAVRAGTGASGRRLVPVGTAGIGQ